MNLKTTLLFALACVLLISACKNQNDASNNAQPNNDTLDVTTEKVSSTEIEIAAADYTATNATVEMITVENNKVVITDGGTWVEYNVDVLAAGRYRYDVFANGKGATLWMEDYVDNKDGRTYDITGHIKIEKSYKPDVVQLTKEGIPLNKGVHKMRLHIDESGATIKNFKFTLMKALVKTPEVLKQNMKGEEWELVWSDEFDEGKTIDTSKWTYDFGDWGWGNRELQYYTKGKNALIEDGNLVIEARKLDDGSWTSTRLTTREKTTFIYGRIEFRAKVPVEKGNWSAGWTLGDSYVDEKSWPYCGEIDIMESVGYEIDNETGKGKAHASIHCGAYYFKLGNHPTSTIDVADMKTKYHTYRIDWDREKIIAYVDDEPYFEFSDTSSQLAWPYKDPQNIILNLAMGGGWGGAQGMDTTVTSQKLYVDYVRVYGKK